MPESFPQLLAIAVRVGITDVYALVMRLDTVLLARQQVRTKDQSAFTMFQENKQLSNMGDVKRRFVCAVSIPNFADSRDWVETHALHGSLQ